MTLSTKSELTIKHTPDGIVFQGDFEIPDKAKELLYDRMATKDPTELKKKIDDLSGSEARELLRMVCGIN